jgi:hypothetical protein
MEWRQNMLIRIMMIRTIWHLLADETVVVSPSLSHIDGLAFDEVIASSPS